MEKGMEEEAQPGSYLDKLSDDYFSVLEDAKAAHANTNKFSGKFIRPHAKHIKTIIEKYDIKSILDYGCGKGQQYEWIIPNANIEQWVDGVLSTGSDTVPHGKTLEEFWGIEVEKFDPAYPAFEKEPSGPSDLVIVSHVLGSIPPADLPIIVDRLYSLTNKYLYVVEAVGRPKKVWTDKDLGLRSAMDWIDILVPHNTRHVRTELVVRYRNNYGSFMGRFVL